MKINSIYDIFPYNGDSYEGFFEITDLNNRDIIETANNAEPPWIGVRLDAFGLETQHYKNGELKTRKAMITYSTSPDCEDEGYMEWTIRWEHELTDEQAKTVVDMVKYLIANK